MAQEHVDASIKIAAKIKEIEKQVTAICEENTEIVADLTENNADYQQLMENGKERKALEAQRLKLEMELRTIWRNVEPEEREKSSGQMTITFPVAS